MSVLAAALFICDSVKGGLALAAWLFWLTAALIVFSVAGIIERLFIR